MLKQRAQNAIEYLLNYSWALIAISIFIVVMVFSGAGVINPTICTSFSELLCNGVFDDGEDLMIVLQNATGRKITINPSTGIAFMDKVGYAVIVYKGTEYVGNVTIAAGDKFIIKGKGMATEKQVTMTYKKEGGLTKTETTTFSTGATSSGSCNGDPMSYCQAFGGNKAEVGTVCRNSGCQVYEKWCSGLDVTRDGKVDLSDPTKVLSNLDKTGCNYIERATGDGFGSQWCEKTDLDQSGKVDLEDYYSFYEEGELVRGVDCDTPTNITIECYSFKSCASAKSRNICTPIPGCSWQEHESG